MKIPKTCEVCGSPNIHTETGTEVTRYFKNGKLISTYVRPNPRIMFCDSCYEELSEGVIEP